MTDLHTRICADGTVIKATAVGGQVRITDDGDLVGVVRDLEAAFDAYHPLLTCQPDDEFITPDAERLPALLEPDVDWYELDGSSFEIVINGHSVDIELDIGESQDLASVSDGDLRGCSASVIGNLLWQVAPDMEDECWVRGGVSDDLHVETLDWLKSCPFQENGAESEVIMIDSPHLTVNDNSAVIALFEHLLTGGGQIRINGRRVHTKT